MYGYNLICLTFWDWQSSYRSKIHEKKHKNFNFSKLKRHKDLCGTTNGKFKIKFRKTYDVEKLWALQAAAFCFIPNYGKKTKPKGVSEAATRNSKLDNNLDWSKDTFTQKLSKLLEHNS